SVGGTSRKDPPKVPTAVRVPATITTSVDFDMSILRDWVNVGRGLAGGRCGSGEAPGQGQPFIQAVAGTVEIDAQGGHVLLELVDQSPRRFERILQGLGGSRLAGSSVAGFPPRLEKSQKLRCDRLGIEVGIAVPVLDEQH